MFSSLKNFFTGGEKVRSAREQIAGLTSKELERGKKGLKSRDQELLRQQQGVTRRHALKLLATALGAVGLGVGGNEVYEVLSRPGRVDFHPVRFSPSQKSDIEGMMENQEVWKQITMRALDRFEDSHPRVAQLKAFTEQNAVYPIAVGPQVTQLLMQDPEESMRFLKNPIGFEIVFMSPQYAQSMPSSILTEPGGKTVRLAETFTCLEWLGIMLSHELSHVDDQLNHGEDSRDRDQYMKGEVRAHLFEKELLKLWGSEQFEQMVDEGFDLAKKADIDGFRAVAERYFPLDGLNPGEESLALASCMMSVLMEGYQLRGADEEELVKVYESTARAMQGGDSRLPF
ncbi:MAG: hypothetical protein Q8O95_04490 [bacterium]|nr:hypothetical protein [bacterium]